MFGASWKTTAAGIAMILGAVSSIVVALLDGNPATSPNWEVALAAIAGGVGLIFAKDRNVSNATTPGAAKPVP